MMSLRNQQCSNDGNETNTDHHKCLTSVLAADCNAQLWLCRIVFRWPLSLHSVHVGRDNGYVGDRFATNMHTLHIRTLSMIASVSATRRSSVSQRACSRCRFGTLAITLV